MTDERLRPPLPSQQRSSTKERAILDPEGKQQFVRVLTCQTTALFYCLHLTGRTKLEGMEEEIDRAVNTMLNYSRRPNKTGDLIFGIGSTDFSRWLTIDNQIPGFSLLLTDGQKPVDWRTQLDDWLRAGGAAVVAWGGHARAFVEDETEGNFVKIDPATASKEVTPLTALPEEAFYQTMLIPPLPERTSKAMMNLLRARVARLKPLRGREILQNIIGSITYEMAGIPITERDYLSRGDGVIRLKPYQIRTEGLPRVITIDADKDGKKDVVIQAPNKPPRIIPVPSQRIVVRNPRAVLKVENIHKSPPKTIKVEKGIDHTPLIIRPKT